MQALPIIPWIGGKRRLARVILPLFSNHLCYVEPFCGAAALFFLKQPADTEVLNDINGELVNLYRVVKNHVEEFVRQFKWALTSRQVFEWEKMTVPETLTDIQRAARFYYLQKLAFGGRVESQSFGTVTTGGSRLNLLRIEEELSAAYLRLSPAIIERLSWADCIARYDRPHTLFYCDPPYWDTEGYGVDFELHQYDRMAELARSITGTMIISVNDHPEMRRAFQGLPMQSVPITYTVGGGINAAERHELIIGNWKDGWPPPRPLTTQLDLDRLI
jgi:DNA adenine methylase